MINSVHCAGESLYIATECCFSEATHINFCSLQASRRFIMDSLETVHHICAHYQMGRINAELATIASVLQLLGLVSRLNVKCSCSSLADVPRVMLLVR